ncbi:nitroreductase family protein [Rhizobium leguminosarum]|uniref:nitroreductase family protein n=1 Tax=Rhizobium leguminosarum TaxID=384 RepID=UPI0019EFD145|nr:nitroreductase family protein [Rhizobium leguminosarum]NKL22553.1 hypothetical protein [Rhizobium leguminosarum bv. viciae]
MPRLPPPSQDFVEVLHARRSERLLEPVTFPEVAAVVREALKADFVGTGSLAGRKRKRMISAGALHPVRCVVIDRDARAVAYDDERDEFVSIEPRNASLLAVGLAKSEAVLPTANGHIISLISDTRAPSAVYENPQSLTWRDAGAVLQTLALVSEAFNLGFCPLGILGQELADAMLPEGHQFLGVGVAVIGRRVAR